jgi:hypothetical protein
MKLLVRTSMILLSLAAALVLGGAARATSLDATRTPTATATAMATPTPTPTLLPTEISSFSGEVWVGFGAYPIGWVTAKIGNTVCGQEVSCVDCIRIPVNPQPLSVNYRVDVLPADIKPGCGYEGAPVTFFVGDKQARQTGLWHAGASQNINLSGRPFSFFQGSMTLSDGLEPPGSDDVFSVAAFVGGLQCHRTSFTAWDGRSYYAVVTSDEHVPGCGIEGAAVSFKLYNKMQIIAVAKETGVWHAWDGASTLQQLDLTMVPIVKLSNVGDGGSQRNDDALWAEIPLGLSLVGLVGIATAVALRRRTAVR